MQSKRRTMSGSSQPPVSPVRTPAGPEGGWRGRLDLGFEARGGRTVLASRAHEGPLMVQSPFYPEGPVCHAYLLHPPGGVVGGDRLHVAGRLHERSHALLTTPAATKVYRSAGGLSRIEQELYVASDATLEWLPQRTLVFSGARAHASTRIHLRGAARFLGWEAVCLGRPAAGECFDRGAMRQDFELWKDGEPLMMERNAFDAASPLMRAAWGLDRRRALASLLLYPAGEHLPAAARAVLERFDAGAARTGPGGFNAGAARTGPGGFNAGAARAEPGGFNAGRAAVTLVDGVLACRIISDDTERVWDLLVALWRTLRPLFLAREAAMPRIWAV